MGHRQIVQNQIRVRKTRSRLIRPRVYQPFMLNTTEHEIFIAHINQILENTDFLALKLSDVVFILLLNV